MKQTDTYSLSFSSQESVDDGVTGPLSLSTSLLDSVEEKDGAFIVMSNAPVLDGGTVKGLVPDTAWLCSVEVIGNNAS